jgi:hypothetical protein
VVKAVHQQVPLLQQVLLLVEVQVGYLLVGYLQELLSSVVQRYLQPRHKQNLPLHL